MSKQDSPVRAIFLALVFIVVIPCTPILISGRWGWWEAWVYAGVTIVGFAVSRLLAARHDPGIIKERSRFLKQENAEIWDRVLAPLVGLGGGLIPIAAGLDARFASPVELGLALKIVSLAIILIGYAVSSYALIENSFFSGMVRIQDDRGHHVIDTGPYRWVRHPGYSGALLTYLVTPLLLDSLWAYLPVACITVILVIRTRLEDRTLQSKLKGYSEYAERVRYRLIPGVW